MATLTVESVYNPETDGPIQGLYKKVKTYLPDVENQTIEKFDRTINTVMGSCDKVVANASTQLRNRVPDIKSIQNYATSLTQKVFNEIEDRLNNLINKFESEEAPASAVVAIKKTEPETRLVRLFRKSRKLNGLVIRRIITEALRLADTAIHINYPHIFLQLAGNVILEARVVRRVATELVSEWVDQQMRNLKVSFRRTKDGFSFALKNLRDPAAIRDQISSRLIEAKNVTMKIVDNCLHIKIDQETLIKNYHVIQAFVSESFTAVREAPKKVVLKAIGDSKALYDKMVREYRVKKILMSRDTTEAPAQISVN